MHNNHYHRKNRLRYLDQDHRLSHQVLVNQDMLSQLLEQTLWGLEVGDNVAEVVGDPEEERCRVVEMRAKVEVTGCREGEAVVGYPLEK